MAFFVRILFAHLLLCFHAKPKHGLRQLNSKKIFFNMEDKSNGKEVLLPLYRR